MAKWWEREAVASGSAQQQFKRSVARHREQLYQAQRAAWEKEKSFAPPKGVATEVPSFAPPRSRSAQVAPAAAGVGPQAVATGRVPALPERYQEVSWTPPTAPEPEPDTFWEWMWSGAKERVGEAWERPTLEEPVIPEEEDLNLWERIVGRFERGHEELEGQPPVKRVLGAVAKAPGVLLGTAGDVLGEAWEGTVGQTELGQGVEQVAGAGLQVMEEIGMAPERLAGAAGIALKQAGSPELQDVPVSEWAPLTDVSYSLAWQQAQERMGIRDPEELQPGEEVSKAWGRDVLGQALADIKSGRRTADEIVREEELPMVEFIGRFATDPLNVIDALNPSNLRRVNAAIDAADLSYGARVAELAVGAEKVADAAQASRLRQVFGGAKEALEAVNPLALTASAKVEQDASNVYLLVSGLVEDAANGREALRRLEDWRARPQMAADLYGEAFASEKAMEALKVLGEVDTSTLVSTVPGRTFSPRMFAREMEMGAREILEDLHGVADPKYYRKFARGFKGMASEFYLTLNPGYYVRNGVDATTTLAYDGILARDLPRNLDDYLQRASTVTKRVATKGLPPESKLPSVLGKFSDRVKTMVGKSPVGEEGFYKRGYVGAHRRTMGKTWHSGANVPEVPAELAHLAGDLRAAASSGMNLDEVADAVRATVGAQTPGEGLQFVMRYLDDDQLAALSPAMLDHLRQGVVKAESWEDVQKLLVDAKEEILARGDDALRTTFLDTGNPRAVWTDTELEELKTNLATSMLEDARRMGLDEEQAVQTLAGQLRWMESQESLVSQATSRTMQRAADLKNNEAMQIVYRANRRQQQTIGETRRVVDAAREKAWTAAEQVGGRGAARKAETDRIWLEYFDTTRREWSRNFTQRLEEMEVAYQDLERLAQGAPFEEISRVEARAVLEEQVRTAAERARVAMGDLEEAADFDERLGILRARVDQAQGRAWEAAMRSADQRTLDILDSADRMNQTIARKWRAEREFLRESFLQRKERALAALERAKEISTELRRETNVELFNIELSYRQAQDKLAMERFRELGQVWQVAELEIRGAPATSRVEKLLALDLQHTHGLPPEEAARLAAERVGVGPLPEGRLAETVSSVAEELAGVRDVGLRAGQGAARHPRVDELLAITEPQALEALQRIEDGLTAEWDLWQARQLDEATLQRALEWVDTDVAPAMRDAHIVSAAAAEQITDFAMHNYSRTTKLDDFLSLIYPYHFWYSRSGMNWARRLANNPSRLATYLQYKTMMQDINEQRGLRARFEGKWKLPVPEQVRDALGLEWMSPAVYFDPVQLMFPYATFDRANFESEEETNNFLARAYRDMKQFMPQPYAFLQVPLQLSEVGGLEERESFTDIWPQTAQIRAATAMLGIGGPEGVDLESWLRRALQLPAQEQWQPYRVRRMLASMAADEPSTTTMALMAQELQDRVEAQEIELAVAIGDKEPKGSELHDLAEQYNWTPAELTKAQAMLWEATRRSALELGIRKLTSYTTGFGATVLAEGEETQMALQREGLEKLWSPEQPEGSYAAYREWKGEHPEVIPRQKQYRELPDIEAGGRAEIQERQGLEPAEHANYLKQKAAKAEIHQRYDDLVAEHLRANPQDWDGYKALNAKRFQEIGEVEARWPMPEDEREGLDLASGELPEGWRGQSPEEYADYVAEQVADAIQETAPSAAAYAGAGGEVDWGAYYDALDAWEAGLPETVPQLEAVRQFGGTYAGMPVRDIVAAVKQRYDDPLEAVARVYRDQLGEAWDAYHRLKDSDEEAYDKTVAVFDQRIAATAFIDQVLETYKTKGWTAEELKRAYAGVVFPPREQTARGGGGEASTREYVSGETYGETAARVQKEGWRAVYGLPWWEKYPRRSRGGGGGGRRSGGGRWASRNRWVPPRWREPWREYGGPKFRRGR